MSICSMNRPKDLFKAAGGSVCREIEMGLLNI
jgi:hypothetical protein